MALRYETSASFHGDPDKVLEAARSIFMANGFQIERPGHYKLAATGPGMGSTRRAPLRGVSHATLAIGGSELRMSATLGAVRNMQRFILLFPPALGALHVSLFYLLGMLNPELVLTILLVLVPWLMISPLLSRWVRRRTVASVDTLMQDVASAA